MAHTNMCNARTYIYVTLEYEMLSVRTYVTYENIMSPKYENMVSGVRTYVTYENV